MLERYRSLVESRGGQVHRSEDWGRLQLAYTIEKLHKAHYLLMNLECDAETLAELEGIFRFNDAILRHLVVRRSEAVTEPSIMLKRKEEKDERESRRRRYERDDDSDTSDTSDTSDNNDGDDDDNDADSEDTTDTADSTAKEA